MNTVDIADMSVPMELIPIQLLGNVWIAIQHAVIALEDRIAVALHVLLAFTSITSPV